MSEYILQCEGICKSYGAKAALKDVSFSLEAGKIVGLLGPNGSGKTTLIKILNQLIQPGGGSAFVCGEPLSDKSKGVISYLPDRVTLPDKMRVRELIELYADFYEDFSADRANEMTEHLGVDQNARFKTLSKGTKEKVQLILAMSRRAHLYLLDEPMGGVDPATRDYILDTIISNFGEDSTIVISTHLIADVEKVLDEAIFIREGEIVMQDSVDNIRSVHRKSVDELFREVFRCSEN